MTIQLRQISESASQAAIRHHVVVVDRPVDKGGTDQGPMGGELFLAAIGGCFMSNLLAAMKVRQVEVSDARADVIATLEGTPAQFTKIEICVSAESVDPEAFAKLVEIAERGCIMVNTLRGKLDLQVRIGGLELAKTR